MKKALKWIAGGLAAYLIIVHPNTAANLVERGGGAAKTGADGATTFVDRVTK